MVCELCVKPLVTYTRTVRGSRLGPDVPTCHKRGAKRGTDGIIFRLSLFTDDDGLTRRALPYNPETVAARWSASCVSSHEKRIHAPSEVPGKGPTFLRVKKRRAKRGTDGIIFRLSLFTDDDGLTRRALPYNPETVAVRWSAIYKLCVKPFIMYTRTVRGSRLRPDVPTCQKRGAKRGTDGILFILSLFTDGDDAATG